MSIVQIITIKFMFVFVVIQSQISTCISLSNTQSAQFQSSNEFQLVQNDVSVFRKLLQESVGSHERNLLFFSDSFQKWDCKAHPDNPNKACGCKQKKNKFDEDIYSCSSVTSACKSSNGRFCCSETRAGSDNWKTCIDITASTIKEKKSKSSDSKDDKSDSESKEEKEEESGEENGEESGEGTGEESKEEKKQENDKSVEIESETKQEIKELDGNNAEDTEKIEEAADGVDSETAKDIIEAGEEAGETPAEVENDLIEAKAEEAGIDSDATENFKEKAGVGNPQQMKQFEQLASNVDPEKVTDIVNNHDTVHEILDALKHNQPKHDSSHQTDASHSENKDDSDHSNHHSHGDDSQDNNDDPHSDDGDDDTDR